MARGSKSARNVKYLLNANRGITLAGQSLAKRFGQTSSGGQTLAGGINFGIIGMEGGTNFGKGGKALSVI